MEFLKNLALSSAPVFLAIQFTFLVVVACIRMRRLIDTRIGGIDVIEVGSWTRLISGIIVCNGAFLLMHHLYLSHGPSPASQLAFYLWFVGLLLVGGIFVSVLGAIFDSGKAIRVLTDRFKPEYDTKLVDMTQDGGKVAQLIPRGAIFSYQMLFFYTVIVIYMK